METVTPSEHAASWPGGRNESDRMMETTTPDRVVHCFDPHSHRILCEPGGSDLRSTKHAHGVTCPTCLKLLADRAASGAEGADSASHIL